MSFFKIPRIPYRDDLIFGATFLLIILLSLAFFPLLPEGHESVRITIFLIAVAVLPVVVLFSRNKQISITKPLFFALIGFLLINIIATVFSVDYINSIFGFYDRYTSSILFFYAWLVWVIVCSTALRQSDDRALVLYKTFIAAATAATVLMIFHTFGIGYYSGTVGDYRPIIPGFIGNQNFTAMFIVGVIPMLLAVWPKAVTNFQKIKWLTVLFVLLWGLVMTASRGAMLGLGVAIGLGILFLLIKKFPSYVWKGIGTAVVIFAILFFSFFTLLRPEHNTNSTQTETNTIQYRYIAWAHSLEVIKHNWLTGLGPGNFFLGFKQEGINSLPDGERFDDAHNLLLHITVGSGVPGGVLFLLIIGIAAYYGIRRVWDTQSVVTLSALLGLVALLVAVSFNPVSIPSWVLFGFLLAVLVMSASKDYVFPHHIILKIFFIVLGLGLAVYAIGFMASGAYSTYGVVAYRAADFKTAFDLSNQAYQLNPLNTVARAYRAASNIRSHGNPDMSRSHIENYIALHPNSSGQNKNTADLYFMLYEQTQNPDDLKKSLEHLETSLELEPNNSSLYMRAAYSYFQAGQYEQAMKYMKRTLTLNSQGDVFYAWLILAQLYKNQNATPQALHALEQAQVERPDPMLRKVIQAIKEQGSVEKVDLRIVYPPIDIL